MDRFSNQRNELHIRPLIATGFVLGVGLGGFIDGILFHQILQLHSMLSNVYLPVTVINLEINMFWDGIFHAFTWFMTVWGIILLWRIGQRTDIDKSNGVLFGSTLIGFGSFNVIEGIIDHLVLKLHHVVQITSPTNQLTSDILFVLSGIILICVGFIMTKLYPTSVHVR